MTTIKQIKTEIERRIEQYWSDGDVDSVVVSFELEEILDFLDTLEGHVPENEEMGTRLDEAAEKYRRDSYNKAMLPNIDGPMPEYGGNVKDAFIAGAEWRDAQIPPSPAKARMDERRKG